MNRFSSKHTFQRERPVKGVVPLVLLIALVIDSALPSIFPNAFLGNDQVIISHLLLYFISTFAFYLRHSYILLYAFLFGLLADSYNTTLLGIYAVLYFIIAYLITSLRRHFPRNAIIHMMLFIVAMTIVDFVVYFFFLKLGFTKIDFQQYVLIRLGPTLIYNTALTFFMYFPNRALLSWVGYDDHIIS